MAANTTVIILMEATRATVSLDTNLMEITAQVYILFNCH